MGETIWLAYGRSGPRRVHDAVISIVVAPGGSGNLPGTRASLAITGTLGDASQGDTAA
ncbi:MAG: hypothetical protein H0U40_05795 [Chloroflexia bacterium]|nr:hypothetical protein [Chloroflexia bacterium]